MILRERLKSLWKELGYNYKRIDSMSDAQVCAIWHRMQASHKTKKVLVAQPSVSKVTERDFWTDKEWSDYMIEE